ncbi:MAG TPA: tetratricopeptide repeat protein [Candidatus Obscuribacterales bacterium]
MYWPTPQDYNEAIQNPDHVFCDQELKWSCAELDQLGLPRPISGGFATVYKMNCGDRSVAVRCFLRNIKDQQERYKHIGDFVHSDHLPYTVDFEYLEKGILIKGNWYPILKMEWVEGHLLNEYVELNLNVKDNLVDLAERFRLMVKELAQAGVGHGDLQHGNIMVIGGELRLVDYDGMYVPALRGKQSNELGHRHYQHPKRSKEHYEPYIDNFSAWSIDTSLSAICEDASLWQQLTAGDECLLFREADYRDPTASKAFAVLENHPSEEIRRNCRLLRSFLQTPLEDVPPLHGTTHDASHIQALPPWMEGPDWIRQQAIMENINANAGAVKRETAAKAAAVGLQAPETPVELAAPAPHLVPASGDSQPHLPSAAPQSIVSLQPLTPAQKPQPPASSGQAPPRQTAPRAGAARPAPPGETTKQLWLFVMVIFALYVVVMFFNETSFSEVRNGKSEPTRLGARSERQRSAKDLDQLLLSGNTALMKDNPTEAIASFREALQIAEENLAADSPQKMQSLLGLSKSYLLGGQPKKAGPYLTQLLRVAPSGDDPSLYKEAERLHALYFMEMGDYGSAAWHLDRKIHSEDMSDAARGQKLRSALLLAKCGLRQTTSSVKVGMEYFKEGVHYLGNDSDTAQACVKLVLDELPNMNHQARLPALRELRALAGSCDQTTRVRLLSRLKKAESDAGNSAQAAEIEKAIAVELQQTPPDRDPRFARSQRFTGLQERKLP